MLIVPVHGWLASTNRDHRDSRCLTRPDVRVPCELISCLLSHGILAVQSTNSVRSTSRLQVAVQACTHIIRINPRIHRIRNTTLGRRQYKCTAIGEDRERKSDRRDTNTTNTRTQLYSRAGLPHAESEPQQPSEAIAAKAQIAQPGRRPSARLLISVV